MQWEKKSVVELILPKYVWYKIYYSGTLYCAIFYIPSKVLNIVCSTQVFNIIIAKITSTVDEFKIRVNATDWCAILRIVKYIWEFLQYTKKI